MRGEQEIRERIRLLSNRIEEIDVFNNREEAIMYAYVINHLKWVLNE